MVKTITGLGAQQKRFVDTFNKLTHRHNGWQIWEDFVTMSACAISNRIDSTHYEHREKLYMNRIKRYNPKEAQAFPELMAITVEALDADPEQDFLGALFMALELSNHWKGQFFTPYSLCRMMGDMQTDDLQQMIAQRGFVSVNDPACGAGATLIGFANAAKAKGINYQTHVLFVAQDIDHTAAMMCYIQLSLIGCPGYVIVGDTLRNPVTESMLGESNVWFTPMYNSQVWSWRRVFKSIDQLGHRMPVVRPAVHESSPVQPVDKEKQVEEQKPMQLTLF